MAEAISASSLRGSNPNDDEAILRSEIASATLGSLLRNDGRGLLRQYFGLLPRNDGNVLTASGGRHSSLIHA